MVYYINVINNNADRGHRASSMNSGVEEYLREEKCLTTSANRASHFVGVRVKATNVLTGIWHGVEARRRFDKVCKRL